MRCVSRILVVWAAAGCGGRQQLRGPLAPFADSLFRAADLTCYDGLRNDRYLNGRIEKQCFGTAADTFVAVLIGHDDTVAAIRRVWGGPLPALPSLGQQFHAFQSECGIQIARSKDGRLMSTFRPDSTQGGATRVLALIFADPQQPGACDELP